MAEHGSKPLRWAFKGEMPRELVGSEEPVDDPSSTKQRSRDSEDLVLEP